MTILKWVSGSTTYLLTSAPACEGDDPPSLDTMLQFARSLVAQTGSSMTPPSGLLLVMATPDTGGLDAVTEARLHVLADGCVVLETWDGVMMLPVWPYGTSWDDHTSEVVLADGARVGNGDIIRSAGGGQRRGVDYADLIDVVGWGNLETCVQHASGGNLTWFMQNSSGNPTPIAEFTF
jgi:hypothetical protein